MNKKNIPKILIVIFLIVVIGLIIYKELTKKNIRPEHKTISPKIGIIERRIVIPGTIIPSKEIQVKSQISGVVDKLYVKIGDKVKIGDVIAKIKAVTDPVTYEKLERQYNIAQANFDNRKRNYDRIKGLFIDKVVSTPEYEDAEKQYIIALHELQSIKKELDLMNEDTNAKDATNLVKSTSDGTILELPVKVGGAVMARSSFHEGTNLANIANLASLLFQGKVLESDVRYLSTGMKFNLTIGALKDINLKAVLILISPKGYSTDGSVKFDFWANVDVPKNYETIIRAGYSANADIILEKKEKALLLEEKYVDFSNDSAFVEILDSVKKETKKSFVKLGISDGINIEIVEGINKNTLIKYK